MISEALNLDSNSLVYFLITVVLIFTLFSVILYKIKSGWRRAYRAKGPYLLSAGERKFFDALSHCISAEMYICPKVRLADLVEVDSDKSHPEFWKNFNRISQKHVDFVICKRDDFSPLLIIELDGGSHNEGVRSLRDELVDNVFKDADIPMLHERVSNYYVFKELSERINSAIRSND